MSDLALLVPSRGRPHNVERLLDAMDKTCRGDTYLTVGVDDDDPTLPEYLALDGCEVVHRPGLQGRLVEWLNGLAVPRAANFRFLGHIGDDNVPRSDGWDVKIIDSLEGQGNDAAFCFGDDLDPGRQPGSLSIHMFMRSAVVGALGYMGPPRIQHMYIDPVWFAWGQATSCEFLPDVVLEHLHYSLGKAPLDDSYRASTGRIPEDCASYNDYCDDPGGMNADIEKLAGRPFTVEAMAEFNRRLNIPRRWG